MDTLAPQELGWWYTVSDDISFQECRTCEKRSGKDHNSKCLKNRKRKNTGSRKSQEKKQTEEHTTVGNLRTLRPRQDHNYLIPDSDDEDMKENPEEIQ